MALRIIFMGTPDFAVPTLRALHRAGHEVVACYSQPPRPAGRRGLTLKPSPVAAAAEELGVEVRAPKSLKSEAEQVAFSAFDADLAVVVAYGLLLPQPILDAPRYGCFNGHASLLPRWRGAAPIQRAIMAGDHETGVCIMQMEAGLDTGSVALERRVAIDESTTAGILHNTLAEVTADAMVDTVTQLEKGPITLTPQSEDGVEYAAKIEKGETRISFARPAAEVHRHIMGLSPFPGAWTEIDGTRVKVLESALAKGDGAPGIVLDEALTIACANGAVRLLRVQKAGGKPMEAADFLRGTSLNPGTVLP
jgi:methionyl-tRNA formyltransferase